MKRPATDAKLASAVRLAVTWLCASLAPIASAQELPDRVRLLRPSCEGAIDWGAFEAALRVELRSMGSDLAEGSDAAARLSLDPSCDAAAGEVVAVLTHVASGRSIEHRVELGAPTDPERARVLAVALSELVRARFAELAREPAPPAAPPAPEPPAAFDPAMLQGVLRGEIRRAVRDAIGPPAPVPSIPRTYLDLALAVGTYPMGQSVVGELRGAVSFRLADLARMGLELAVGGGGADDPLGATGLFVVGGGASVRAGHAESSLVIEAGPRIDLGFAYAAGIPRAGARGGSVASFTAAAGLDARLRARLAGALWLCAAIELGAALIGLDARAEDRRVTAQLGPRLGLVVGIAIALE